MITKQQASDLIGATAYDPGGAEVGEVATVYLGQASGEPEWLTVTTGLFGPRQTFVPTARAHLRGPREVEFDLDKDTITAAPNIDPDGELAGQEEAKLFQHYGMAHSHGAARPAWKGPAGRPMAQTTPEPSLLSPKSVPGAAGITTCRPKRTR
jgi:PRC-barrel domain